MMPDVLDLAQKIRRVARDPKFLRDKQVGLQFLQAAVRDPQELSVFGTVVPLIALGYIRGDRNRSRAHLRGEPKSLSGRTILRGPVNGDRQALGQLPDAQIPEAIEPLLRHVSNLPYARAARAPRTLDPPYSPIRSWNCLAIAGGRSFQVLGLYDGSTSTAEKPVTTQCAPSGVAIVSFSFRR